ncbi:prenyltransferase/squalene oxidase repeat-containing protein [Thalassoglobus sp. JC818]|uniref:prenyltransferase/squalene oxidase repeat-containing protein n=1 Tax=Thalassoglobus sp. JC818 TaxID=3232136 RepID=UPI0034574DE2
MSRQQFKIAFLLVGMMSLWGFPSEAFGQDYSPADVDESIVRAVQFLSSQQTDVGAWRTESWGESTAITSLAVMSFLAAGHVPGEGPYGEQINQGVRWVVEHQQPNGMLVHQQRSHGPMYSHGICTLMLAEVVGMMDEADEPIVRRALEKAILLILESQSVAKNDRHRGGWRYQTNSRDSDLSVTGWQVLALRAAKDIGCDVPAEAIDAAVDYVRNCAGRNDQGFGYQPGNGPTPTLTGTGITCLEVCGAHHSKEALGGAEWLAENPLRDRSSYFFYGAYYTGIGLFKIGGDVADLNHEHLVTLLLPQQDDDGGWTPRSGSERQAGRIYATSLAVLALAVEYRYLPIYQR